MLRFLRSIDSTARFKAFAKLADLKRHLDRNKVHFVIVSQSAKSKLGSKLRAVATPRRGVTATYEKVLVVKKGTNPAAIKVVATTSPRAEIAAIELSGRSTTATAMRVLRVSKGFDALLGMAFNRADAAYVTPATVAALTEVDKKLASSLHEIYRSPPIPNPQLFTVEPHAIDSQIRDVVGAFEKMHESKIGRSALKILDYTSWSKP